MKTGEKSYANKFDLYYPSSYLPHVTVTEKDELDDLVEKPSTHTRAFRNAKGMVVPPAPSQKLKSRQPFADSMVEGRTLPKPINLAYSFEQNADTPEQSIEEANTPSEERTPTKEKAPVSYAPFDDRSPTKVKTPDIETASKKSTSPSTIEGIKDFFYRMGAEPDTFNDEEATHSKYDELWSKMGSIAKTLSSAPRSVKHAASGCENSMCNFMEAAQEIMTFSTLRQTGYGTGTPLDKSWLEVEHDSDSISKLTTPFNETSMLSEGPPFETSTSPVEVSRTPSAVNTSATRTTMMTFDWK